MCEDEKRTACDKIEASSSALHHVSQELWKNPELAGEEVFAHNLLTDFLEKEGFSVQREYVLKTAFRATFQTAEEPHVVVICEYDALPGIGHACGHNLIAEVGLAAGLGIKEVLEKHNVKGKVTVLGTPAEETYGGKIDLIRAGAFEGVCAAMMAHPSDLTIVHEDCLSMLALEVTFTGKATHAAGSPWDGINALDAAVTAYQNVSNLRQQMKPDWRVHGIIKDGGKRPNIIPEKSVLEYYVRAPTDKERDLLEAKVRQCFTGAAQATGCECLIEQVEHAYSNLVSNSIMIKSYLNNAALLGIKMDSKTDHSLGSTDMGNVSYTVPSIHPMFHIGGFSQPHSHDFTALTGADAAQLYTLNQGKALAMTAIDILSKSVMRTEMMKVFAEDMLANKA